MPNSSVGYASVQTTECYFGCKQNLGHPVNDLFALGKNGQSREEKNVECVTVKGSPVEKAFCQGIECRHGGSEHDQPVCDSRPLSLQNEPIWSRSEETISRKAFDAALEQELDEVMQEAKKMASQIKEPYNSSSSGIPGDIR